MKPRAPAIARSSPVTISRASHVDTTVASAAASVRNANPSMKSAKIPAPTSRPMPSPSAASFALSSEAASSSSSRTIELTRSETAFAAAPRPPPERSPAWVGMASPIDPLRESDAEEERRADDDERVGAAAAAALLRLRAPAELRPGGRLLDLRRLPVGGRIALHALLDQVGLELAQELGVVGQLGGELVLDAALPGELLRLVPRLVRQF